MGCNESALSGGCQDVARIERKSTTVTVIGINTVFMGSVRLVCRKSRLRGKGRVTCFAFNSAIVLLFRRKGFRLRGSVEAPTRVGMKRQVKALL